MLFKSFIKKASVGAALLILSLTSCVRWGIDIRAMTPFEDPATRLWGYRDRGGEVVISPRFRAAGEFTPQGIAPAADDNGWMYIDARGGTVIRPYIFDNGPDYFSQELARFTENGKFGFFDRRGRVVIPPRFDFAEPFSEGLAAVCLGCRLKRHGEHASYEGGRWGYIDRAGDIAIPLKYEKALAFESGTARAVLRGRWVRIHRDAAPSD